jgi:hypothetical protein
MARLYLFAEGQTEQTFADDLLKPHLAAFGVYLHNAVLIAHARRRGKTHRGGGRSYRPMKDDIVRLLKQERAKDVFFTTMIDLYALHADFPGLAQSEEQKHDPRQRVETLEEGFSKDIGDPRFIPYIQLHEFEAMLFCKPDVFATYFEDAEKGTCVLHSIAEQFANPEFIDDGPHTAPSKRIIGVFPGYEGAKATAGPILADSIGLSEIRSKCYHFDEWLTKLESLPGIATTP